MPDKKYSIGGYAPGNYYGKCTSCGNQFRGDKHALQCEPCAIKDKEFWDALTPEQQERFDKIGSEIVKLFFEGRDKDEQIARLKKALLNLVHLKAHKETYGKDEYYEKEQPLAWQQATEALKQ